MPMRDESVVKLNNKQLKFNGAVDTVGNLYFPFVDEKECVSVYVKPKKDDEFWLWYCTCDITRFNSTK